MGRMRLLSQDQNTDPYMKDASSHDCEVLDETAWEEIRFWRIFSWVGVLLSPVVGFAVEWLFSWVGLGGDRYISIAAAFACFLYFSRRLFQCRCPRCKERFFVRRVGGSFGGRHYNAFSVKCLSCETPIGATSIDAPLASSLTDAECLSCGKSMPRGTDQCPGCGWTYNT